MRKLKDVLRLKLNSDQSHQQIATALGIAKGSVTKYCSLAATAGLGWSAVQAMSETDLEQCLFGSCAKNQLRHGVSPIFGQLGFFNKFAGKDHQDKRLRYRYVAESKRLFGVLNQHL
jgi:hypothetical protein